MTCPVCDRNAADCRCAWPAWQFDPARDPYVVGYRWPDLDEVVPAAHLRWRMLERLDESCEEAV